jgi:outer membrane protein TolC
MPSKLTLLFLAAGLALAGCVRSDLRECDLIDQYQRELVSRGVQSRLTDEPCGLLRPSEATVPPLEVVQEEGQLPVLKLSLEEAIHRALANSQEIRVVSYDPSIARQELIAAEAEFDVISFANFLYQKDDVRTDSLLAGNETLIKTFSAGLRQRTITGASWEASYSWTRTYSDNPFQLNRTQYEPVLQLQAIQPLLRNAWSTVNLAGVRIARLNERISRADFRRQVEETLGEVITTYWQVFQARGDIEIQEVLLAQTRETLRRIEARAEEGLASDATVQQSRAAVEGRFAELLRARKRLEDVQDTLSRLIADRQLNLLCEYKVLPTTPPVTDLVELDVADQLVTALRCNPVLEQARLAISVADVNVTVAKNQTLPQLNLVASGQIQGLGATRDNAHDSFSGGDYASYSFGLEFEYPLGNRAAEADLRRFRLEKLKTVTALQNVADQVAVAVRERVRQVQLNHQEVRAYRAATEAALAQVNALQAEDETRARLTPEFLQVKLQAQGTLAEARRNELRAVVSYNAALADLARITGSILDLHQVELAMPAVLED